MQEVADGRIRLVQLGKFGAFPARHLLGLHYDITYEITPSSDAASGSRHPTPTIGEDSANGVAFGQVKGKKRKKDKGPGKGEDGDVYRTNPGWRNSLRPLKRQPLVDAVVGQ